MTSVELLVAEIGRLTIPVGQIDFYNLPVQKPDDFVCVPPNLLCFADVQTISMELAQQILRGKIGRYKWRKIS